MESVYKRFAADINNDEKISASDLLALRKVILGIDMNFENNTSWRFIDAGHEFVNDANPWESPVNEAYNIEGLSQLIFFFENFDVFLIDNFERHLSGVII